MLSVNRVDHYPYRQPYLHEVALNLEVGSKALPRSLLLRNAALPMLLENVTHAGRLREAAAGTTIHTNRNIQSVY